MADAIRTRAVLQGLLADNVTGDSSNQDVRDFLVSTYNWVNKTVGGDIYYAEGNVGVGDFSATPIATPLHVDGLLTLGLSGGTSGGIRFIASDGDLVNVDINTSDALLFSGAAGGYLFDSPVNVSRSSGSEVSQTHVNPGGGGYSLSISALTGTGDPKVHFGNSAANWSVGMDTDDSATFKIGHDIAVGTSTDLSITTGGLVAVEGNRFAIRTVSNGLANNAAGTIGDMAIGTDTNTYLYIWFGSNTPSRVQLATW